MNRTLLFAALLALCPPALAQSYRTTPNGGLAQEGPQYTYIFGWFSDGRIQMADGMQRGNSATMTRISFRLDNRDHTSLTAAARSWTNITLDISETANFDQMGQNWSANSTTTPTTVFNSAWNWQGQTGFPLLKPDAWGGRGGRLSFPFRSPWTFSGKNDLLMDYQFRGGTLANSGPWTSAQGNPFFLDSEHLNTFRNLGAFNRLPAVPGNCADSAAPNTSIGAMTIGYAMTFGANAPIASQQNSLVLTHYSYYSAPFSTVVHAFGVDGSTQGVDIGARCNKLYVDLWKPILLMTLQTGDLGATGLQQLTLPWRAAFANRELYLQGAWTDSRTRAFSLTQATQLTTPNGLPVSQPPRYKTTYSTDVNAPTSLFMPVSSGFYFPYTQYQIK